MFPFKRILKCSGKQNGTQYSRRNCANCNAFGGTLAKIVSHRRRGKYICGNVELYLSLTCIYFPYFIRNVWTKQGMLFHHTFHTVKFKTECSKIANSFPFFIQRWQPICLRHNGENRSIVRYLGDQMPRAIVFNPFLCYYKTVMESVFTRRSLIREVGSILPIQPSKRPYFYVRIMMHLHELLLKY